MTPLPSDCADVDGDGFTTIRDLVLVAKALFTQPGHPRWNPDADVNDSGRVDFHDFFRVFQSFFDRDCRPPGHKTQPAPR
jgi:hypothetical protein